MLTKANITDPRSFVNIVDPVSCADFPVVYQHDTHQWDNLTACPRNDFSTFAGMSLFMLALQKYRNIVSIYTHIFLCPEPCFLDDSRTGQG